MMNTRLTALGILACAAFAAAGCSNSANQLLTTGSLFGSGDTKPNAVAAAPAVVKPEDRAIHVGATSARAQKCGYFFDPAKLRASYLASEAQAGTTPDAIAQLARVYDITAAKVTAAIASNDTYCSDAQVGKIKSSLTRQLAGDFSPPQNKTVALGNPLDWGEPVSSSQEKLNPDWVNNPTVEPQTKRVEDE